MIIKADFSAVLYINSNVSLVIQTENSECSLGVLAETESFDLLAPPRLSGLCVRMHSHYMQVLVFFFLIDADVFLSLMFFRQVRTLQSHSGVDQNN